MTSNNPIILGLDTGFKNIGFTVARIEGARVDDLRILDIGYFDTEKSSGKRKGIRSADDNFERARTIASTLRTIANQWNPDVLTFEAMSFVRSAPTMAKIGMCFGVVSMLVETLDVPVLSATPQEIKKAVCNDKSASKEAIQAALDARFKNAPKQRLDKVKLANGKREHPYDSLGSILACWDTEVMRLMRGRVS